MIRGLAGRTRKGAPPLPRQRLALRVVQSTLIGVAAFLGSMAYREWTAPVTSIQEVIGPGALAATFAASGLWMGIRTVRGPRPPDLDR